MDNNNEIHVSFKLSQREHQPEVWEIKVEGELNLTAAGQMEEAFDRARPYGTVLIDLSECEFIDSTGLAIIVRALRSMRAEGRRLALYSPDANIFRYLQVIGVEFDGLVFNSAESALSRATPSR
jgi:anti-anti-sigma factor